MDNVHLGSTEKIKLNVGGKQFEVSRSVVNQYPETMIGRLVSDTWQNTNHEETIFIDRDGDMFGHVLNYMRYGSIELPTHVPKSMFQRELDFYQLKSNGNIKQETSIETLKELKQCIEQAELHHDMILIATTCYHQFMMGKKEARVTYDNVELKHSPFHYHFGDAMRVLNHYLGRFHGLKAHATQASLYSNDFVLEIRDANEVAKGEDISSEDMSFCLFNCLKIHSLCNLGISDDQPQSLTLPPEEAEKVSTNAGALLSI